MSENFFGEMRGLEAFCWDKQKDTQTDRQTKL